MAGFMRKLFHPKQWIEGKVDQFQDWYGKEDLYSQMQNAPNENYADATGVIQQGQQEQLGRLDPLMQEQIQRQSELSNWYKQRQATSYQDTAEAQGALTKAKSANADEMNTVENSAMQSGMTPEQKLAYKAKIKQNYDAMLGGLAEKDTSYKDAGRNEYNSLSNLYSSNKANIAGAQNAVTGQGTSFTLGAQNARNQGNADYRNARAEGYQNFERGAANFGSQLLDNWGNRKNGNGSGGGFDLSSLASLIALA